MATRRSFLNTLAIFLAANPAIATGLEIKDTFYTPEAPKKIATFFYITKEMYNDKEGFKVYVNNKATEAGIDLDKQFNWQVGYNEDDFIYNRLTCVISQYV